MLLCVKMYFFCTIIIFCKCIPHIYINTLMYTHMHGQFKLLVCNLKTKKIDSFQFRYDRCNKIKIIKKKSHFIILAIEFFFPVTLKDFLNNNLLQSSNFYVHLKHLVVLFNFITKPYSHIDFSIFDNDSFDKSSM